MLSDCIEKCHIETLEVQSNDTNDSAEFDSVLKAIEGNEVFINELQKFLYCEMDIIF